MIVTIILTLIVFISMLILIAKDVMDRAALVLTCAIITVFILIIFEGADPLIVVDFIFGTSEDGFVNFRAIALIFGILIISSVCYRTGFFEFIAFKLIQYTKGKPDKVLIIVGLMTFFVSSVLADAITAIIMIPLTITICRTLKLNPVPFIIIQALFIKLGATVLPISSIPSILITSYQGISFLEYFTTAGLISLAVAFSTISVLVILNRRKKQEPSIEGLEIFVEYNAWIFVKDKKMMIQAASIFFIVIVLFIMVPSDIIKPELIGITGAIILIILNRHKSEEIIKSIDYSLLLYLIGVFTITGSLQYVGFIDLIGQSLNNLGVTNIGIVFMLLLWIGALASAFIDNIPITQLLLSFINILMGAKGTSTAKIGSLGLALGVIWGDNLSPFGDSILVLNIAKEHGVNVQPILFFKYGFSITIAQLCVISLIILLIFDFLTGLVLLGILAGIILAIIIIRKYFLAKKSGGKWNNTK